MLCEACSDLLSVVGNHSPGTWTGIKPQLFAFPEAASVWRGAHHVEPNSFANAALARCYICSTIFRDCSTELRAQALLFRTFYEVKVAPPENAPSSVDNHYELNFNIEILDGQEPIAAQQVFDCNGTFKILPKEEVYGSGGRPALTSNTFTGKCEKQVRQWLHDCSQDHVECNQDWRLTGGSPARLLNICPEFGDEFLLETFPSNARPPRYVTLSHCWGAGMSMTLTRTNQEKLLNQYSPISSLPPRFRDAVKIARWMNVSHIWIDALCIIQDSKEDWSSESAKMGDIYTGSYFNIAATSADPQKGCFTIRPISMFEPYTIPDPKSHEEERTHIIGYDDFWCNSLLDAPLHQRGWVLQERLLSPRTIHFGQEQIFWECRCELACEAYPNGIPEQLRNRRTRTWRQANHFLDPRYRASFRPTLWNSFSSIWSSISSIWNTISSFWNKPKEIPKDVRNQYQVWSSIVEAYMDCKLTVPEDKLVAISGVAQQMAEATKERYLAGLWENDRLPQSLMWHVLKRRQADGAPSIRSGPEGRQYYRAPSWSWASRDAKIVWNWPVESGNSLISILRTDIIPKDSGTLGKISSGRMYIQGHLFEAKLSIISTLRRGAPDEEQYVMQFKRLRREQLDVDSPFTTALVHLDTPLLPERSSTDVYLLPVCVGWRSRADLPLARIAGLLLKKSETGNLQNAFTRIGIFGLDDGQASFLCGSQYEAPRYLDERCIILV